MQAALSWQQAALSACRMADPSCDDLAQLALARSEAMLCLAGAKYHPHSQPALHLPLRHLPAACHLQQMVRQPQARLWQAPSCLAG